MAIQRWAGWHPVDLSGRFWNTIRENYYLGFTSFGGPPVHFKIVRFCPPSFTERCQLRRPAGILRTTVSKFSESSFMTSL
jgi:hypothetical protein